MLQARSDGPRSLHAGRKDMRQDQRVAAQQRAFLARLRARAGARQFAKPVLSLTPGVDFSGQRVAVTAESDLPEATLPHFERRFRAVLVADVVGYTRLMEAAELDTHTRYRSLRVSVGDPTIAFHRGETVKNTGDGFIAVFESPVDAIRCAVELQREMRRRNPRSRPSAASRSGWASTGSP